MRRFVFVLRDRWWLLLPVIVISSGLIPLGHIKFDLSSIFRFWSRSGLRLLLIFYFLDLCKLRFQALVVEMIKSVKLNLLKIVNSILGLIWVIRDIGLIILLFLRCALVHVDLVHNGRVRIDLRLKIITVFKELPLLFLLEPLKIIFFFLDPIQEIVLRPGVGVSNLLHFGISEDLGLESSVLLLFFQSLLLYLSFQKFFVLFSDLGVLIETVVALARLPSCDVCVIQSRGLKSWQSWRNSTQWLHIWIDLESSLWLPRTKWWLQSGWCIFAFFRSIWSCVYLINSECFLALSWLQNLRRGWLDELWEILNLWHLHRLSLYSPVIGWCCTFLTLCEPIEGGLSIFRLLYDSSDVII